jgi:putative DNA primase/helicase
MAIVNETFNILNYSSSLTLLKEESSQLVCLCPVCGGHRLTIDKKTGAYTCWTGECERHLIRAQVTNRREERRESNFISRKAAVKPKIIDIATPALPTGKLHLLKLSQPATDIPQPETPHFLPKGIPPQATETIYRYSQKQWVSRFEWEDKTRAKGREKTFRQCHIGEKGKVLWTKGDKPWLPYRFAEAIDLLKAQIANNDRVPCLLMGEGEKVVESLREIGLAAITFQGSSWSGDISIWLQQLQRQYSRSVIIFLADNDKTGTKKAGKVMLACRQTGLSSLTIPATAIQADLPESGDVADILTAMNPDEFIRKLELEIQAAVSKSINEVDAEAGAIVDRVPDCPPAAEKNFNEKAFEVLYGDRPWVCLEDKLYFWNGKYYEASTDVIQMRRCAEYCACTPVYKNRKWVYEMATPAAAKNLLRWAKAKLGVDGDRLNPAGLNLNNGILQIDWHRGIPTWKLIPHHPDYLYTYCSEVDYDPAAKTTDCDRLLSVLEPQPRDIFLKVIAASLDLKTVRKYKGRSIRSLLLYGAGANGKDTLREAVALLYGKVGMTNATLADFAAYDSGRKFPLAKLSRCRINWASENSRTNNIDRIESLKAFISGEPISIEHKGKDEYEFEPVGVTLFNVNESPNLVARLEAIQSRYAVLNFNKTFKINANPLKREIEADARFKYDLDFLLANVLPALLNRLLDTLKRLMEEGIDYRLPETRSAQKMGEKAKLIPLLKVKS